MGYRNYVWKLKGLYITEYFCVFHFRWTENLVTIGKIPRPFRLKFEGTKGLGDKTHVALDSITLPNCSVGKYINPFLHALIDWEDSHLSALVITLKEWYRKICAQTGSRIKSFCVLGTGVGLYRWRSFMKSQCPLNIYCAHISSMIFKTNNQVTRTNLPLVTVIFVFVHVM